ncbi:hypothetical protein BGLA2_700022 [Burkholderia gladioli]|nr:hypothetical protein BGLA2_700022 [Burkholderia gladioli]
MAADRHPAGAGWVLLLAGFGCCGVGLAGQFAAHELARMALALAGG